MILVVDLDVCVVSLSNIYCGHRASFRWRRPAGPRPRTRSRAVSPAGWYRNHGRAPGHASNPWNPGPVPWCAAGLRCSIISRNRRPGAALARVAGLQFEMELAFAALHQLCASMRGSPPVLPEPQRDALGTAFGIRAGPALARLAIADCASRWIQASEGLTLWRWLKSCPAKENAWTRHQNRLKCNTRSPALPKLTASCASLRLRSPTDTIFLQPRRASRALSTRDISPLFQDRDWVSFSSGLPQLHSAHQLGRRPRHRPPSRTIHLRPGLRRLVGPGRRRRRAAAIRRSADRYVARLTGQRPPPQAALIQVADALAGWRRLPALPPGMG